MKKKTIEAVVTKLADDGHDYYVLEEIYTIIKAYKQVKRQKKKDKEVPQRITSDEATFENNGIPITINRLEGDFTYNLTKDQIDEMTGETVSFVIQRGEHNKSPFI